jgi:murein DD-endopeptidase MepM/ murein hydrolase activator NlpD
MKFSFGLANHVVGRLFRTRSIIIISESKTNHISLSGALQFSTLMAIVTCVVWASYSTGRYMATRSMLQDREETIRSVANSRIDTNFNFAVNAGPSRGIGPVSNGLAVPLTDPAYTMSAVNHDKLYARIAMLENKVNELRNTNSEIIQGVKEKAHNKILNMEEIIRQAGLNPNSLQEEAGKMRREKQREASNTNHAAGGPFISSDTASGLGKIAPELETKLDEMALLTTIMDALPFGMPLKGAEMQSNFGRRIDPFTNRLAFHAGSDLSGPAGSKILAAGDGKVVGAGWEGAYGNAVDIDHGFGLITRYGHLSSINVTEGEMVKKGQVVGIQGSTGRSTGPHLHYEVRQYNRPLNPANFLSVVSDVSENN